MLRIFNISKVTNNKKSINKFGIKSKYSSNTVKEKKNTVRPPPQTVPNENNSSILNIFLLNNKLILIFILQKEKKIAQAGTNQTIIRLAQAVWPFYLQPEKKQSEPYYFVYSIKTLHCNKK